MRSQYTPAQWLTLATPSWGHHFPWFYRQLSLKEGFTAYPVVGSSLLSLIWPIAPRSADQEPLIWTDPITIRLICFQYHPCETLPDQPDHRCPISPVSLKMYHYSRPGWNAKSGKIPRKYRVREPGASHIRRFWTLSGFARSGFGGRKAHRCRSPPPIIILAAVWRADRASKWRPPSGDN